MGFSLFGSSGDKTTQNTTNNATYDYTRNNTDNIEGSFNTSDSRVFNTALTRNQSTISNDTRIQNTALQLTDSFNRFTTNNLANVGNTNIGTSGTSGDDAAKLLAAMRGLQPNYSGMNTSTPDLSAGLLDFNTLSRIATDNIKASGGVSKDVFTGFADNVTATGNNNNPTSPTTSLLMVAVFGAIALAALFILKRR
jgi:hypothetical protein